MTDYRVGDVVNGHVWTGTAWEPAPPPPLPPARVWPPPDPSGDVKAWGMVSIIGAFVTGSLAAIYLFSDQLRTFGNDPGGDDAISEYLANLAYAAARLGRQDSYWPWVFAVLAVGFLTVAVICFRKAAAAKRLGHPRATSEEK